MKAIRYYNYGSPDVLKLEDVETPMPNDDQVLIKVHAASVNSFEHRHIRAEPFLIRTSNGLLKPQNPKLGADIAGRVEAVGKNITQFKVGDEVFGDIGYGGYAEYVCGREKNIALKPASVSFEDAAASPMAGLTALQGLRHGKIQAGQKVLVNGASGGVGTFAVMIAKFYGAEVTGVCSTRNLEMVRSIGADHVVDYTKDDLSKSGQKYDLIFDVAANRSVYTYRRVLAPKGKYVMAGFSTMMHMFHVLLLGPLAAKAEKQEIGLMETASVNQADLITIGELLESKKIVPVIDKVYPLNETAQALRQFEEVHAQGKIIISVV